MGLIRSWTRQMVWACTQKVLESDGCVPWGTLVSFGTGPRRSMLALTRRVGISFASWREQFVSREALGSRARGEANAPWYACSRDLLDCVAWCSDCLRDITRSLARRERRRY